LATVESAHHRLKTMANKLADGKSWNTDILAELHVGALLIKLGCGVQFLKPVKSPGVRTPDILCRTPNGISIDVEVTCPKEKPGHQIHKNHLSAFTEAIGTSNDANYAIFIAERLSDDLSLRIIDSILTLSPGQRKAEEGKWAIVVGYPEERERFVSNTRDIAPSWWGDGPAFRNVMTRIGGSHSPVTSIATKIPRESYLNPIKQKAERPQRSGANPFLVAVDTTSFPGGLNQIETDISASWFNWTVVSGVLLEFPFFAFRSQHWRCKLLQNPYASRNLPHDWLVDLVSQQGSVTVK
jgi:hypothetical protein